jgi:hypothetical protein
MRSGTMAMAEETLSQGSIPAVEAGPHSGASCDPLARAQTIPSHGAVIWTKNN